MVHDSHQFGGLENVMLRSADALAHEFDVAILVRGFAGTEHTSPIRLIEEAEKMGIRVLRPNTTTQRLPMPIRRMLNVVAVGRLIRRFDPDIVHVHTARVEGGRMHTVVARLVRRCAVVRTEHNSPSAYSTPPFGGIVQRVTDRLTGRVLTVSRSDAAEQCELVGRDPAKVQCVHNGVDVDRFVPASPVGAGTDDLVIGTLGRLTPQKDHATLVAAMAEVHERVPSARCLIVGSGEMCGDLAEQIAALDLDEIIELRDAVDDVVPVLHSFDIGVMTSRHEGLSLALLEMLAAGLPTVVSDHPGLTEAIVEGTTSRVAAIGDPSAFADAMVQLLENPGRRAAFSLAARSHVVENFSFSVHIERLTSVYEDCLKR